MNGALRKKAELEGLPLMDFILRRMDEIRPADGISRTIFAACPNSSAVIKASLRAARRWNSPIKFAATLNQVDLDGGYTGLTQEEFVKTIRIEAGRLNLQVPVIIAIDHGGPWLKDAHTAAKLPLEDTLNAVKTSFEASIKAGYDLIHVDPTVDITLPKGVTIPIETVAERTLALIAHAETFRKAGCYKPIAYEVGTEEVHGGLADMATFRKFLSLLKEGLAKQGNGDVWPCFVVGKVGTDLHTTEFDPVTAGELTKIAREYGSVIKGHYTDGVINPGDYPASGMGAANVGPEFTIAEYNGLMELENLELDLFHQGKVASCSRIGLHLQEAVIASGRWKKWLLPGEETTDFASLSEKRRQWLIGTGCRYIWQTDSVIASRAKLYENLLNNGIPAEDLVLSAIEHAMDRYFAAFNLRNLNDLL